MDPQPESLLTPPSQPSQMPSDAMRVARRTFVFFGLFTIAGCATSRTGDLPGPIWPDLDTVCDVPPPPPVVSNGGAKPMPSLSHDGVIPRSEWARADAVCSRMNPMLPVRHITVHHDGLTPFLATDMTSSKARLEMIRNGHRGRGWGDIGYHYVIDRDGRVWEGRAINWQGAHVEFCNEGNIGICCLGNFEEQAPSAAQLAALERELKALMGMYGVPKSRVLTHKEWPKAKTACPGKALQTQMVAMRKGSRLA